MHSGSNKKMKIAIMSYSMDGRLGKGSSVYTRKLADYFSKDDRLDLTLVHYDKVDDDIYSRVNEVIMPFFRWGWLNRRFFRQLKFFWESRNNKFDIIHWCQPRLYPFFWLAPAKKIVVTFHGGGDVVAPAKFSFSRLIFIWVIKIFKKHIDLAIVDSSAAKEEVSLAYGISKEKIESIYIGGGEDFVPINRLNAEKFVGDRFGIKIPFILDVARLQPHKNINNLIKAYNIFRSNYDASIMLVIVGSPAFEYEETYELAKKSEFCKDIKFIDYADEEELSNLYSAAQIFTFPSLNEGFGLPVVESFASGTPVITSNTTSLPEIAGGAAVLINPHEPESIASVMSRVLSDNELWNKKRSDGLERAKFFTWDKTASKTIEAYLDILNK